VRGVLGQWFLAQFDYTLNLKGRELQFGAKNIAAARTPFRWVNGRPVVTTSLGDLTLDSGQSQLVLFGIQPGNDPAYELHTIAGSQFVGRTYGKPLLVGGRKISDGEGIAMPNKPEAGVDGLLPLNAFKAIYICNSGGYIIFE
jgi:hypothetical protein